MVAAEVSSSNAQLDENNVFSIPDQPQLLKSATIYGANASGKSNLVQAILFMKWFVLNSSKSTQITDDIPVDKFKLSTENEDQPSLFEIVFISGKTRYRYGFEVNTERVITEWLYYVPKSKETNIFYRDSNKISCLKKFKEGKDLIDKTRKNALFISVVAQFNGQLSSEIVLWFNNHLNIISGLDFDQFRQYTIRLLKTNQYYPNIKKLIKEFDLGIKDLRSTNQNRKSANPLRKLIKILDESQDYSSSNNLKNSNAFKSINTLHIKYNSSGDQVATEIFDLDQNESEGTKKIFSLLGILLIVLNEGLILVVDELDARLHPLITRTIVQLFNSNQTNPHNSQLIFMTHDINLLSKNIFRKDQIWFTEKNSYESTDLYSLIDYDMDNETSYEDDYIIGRYGAIPFLGDFSHLIDLSND